MSNQHCSKNVSIFNGTFGSVVTDVQYNENARFKHIRSYVNDLSRNIVIIDRNSIPILIEGSFIPKGDPRNEYRMKFLYEDLDNKRKEGLEQQNAALNYILGRKNNNNSENSDNENYVKEIFLNTIKPKFQIVDTYMFKVNEYVKINTLNIANTIIDYYMKCNKEILDAANTDELEPVLVMCNEINSKLNTDLSNISYVTVNFITYIDEDDLEQLDGGFYLSNTDVVVAYENEYHKYLHPNSKMYRIMNRKAPVVNGDEVVKSASVYFDIIDNSNTVESNRYIKLGINNYVKIQARYNKDMKEGCHIVIYDGDRVNGKQIYIPFEEFDNFGLFSSKEKLDEHFSNPDYVRYLKAKADYEKIINEKHLLEEEYKFNLTKIEKEMEAQLKKHERETESLLIKHKTEIELANAKLESLERESNAKYKAMEQEAKLKYETLEREANLKYEELMKKDRLRTKEMQDDYRLHIIKAESEEIAMWLKIITVTAAAVAFMYGVNAKNKFA